MRGRGKDMPHQRQAAHKEMLHEFSLDYCFPGDTGGVAPLTVLVTRERITRMVQGIVVPRKGAHTPTAQKVVGFVKELGCENVDVVVKSDQEPAIRAMVREICRLRSATGVRTIPESSPAYSSASNGVVERGVQTVEAQMRVMRSALEARWQATVGETHAIWPPLVGHAGFLLNRCEVEHDGKTAYERSKKKVATILGLEFGEIVHWKKGHLARQAVAQVGVRDLPWHPRGLGRGLDRRRGGHLGDQDGPPKTNRGEVGRAGGQHLDGGPAEGPEPRGWAVSGSHERYGR